MATLVRLTYTRLCFCNIEESNYPSQNVFLPRTIIRVISMGVRLNAISSESRGKQRDARERKKRLTEKEG